MSVEEAGATGDEPIDLPTSFVAPSFVVGIGASAGGLEALEQFFDHMPPDSGVAFVIVQHLSPDFKSMMNELLGRHTTMPIYHIGNEMEIAANSIYLIPPKNNLVVSNSKLLLADQDPSGGLNLPIDIFFRSLAQDFGERAIGVVLSGTGSDGTRGIREIHENGGLVLVQDEESAKFDGMPRSATATGLADFELPPHAMPEALLKYVRHPLVDESQQEAPFTDESGVSQILGLLRSSFGLDFTHYKPSTVRRRIERRIGITRCASLQDYVQHVNSHPEEIDSLYSDLLVGVTEFFRDQKAFDQLERDVIPQLVTDASPDGTLRVWVAGCASGEEAYSLAILMIEAVEADGRSLDVKVFATDVHQNALAKAGPGVFEEADLANVTQERVERFFIEKDGKYHVAPELRRSIIFSQHNLVKDPPFTKMDLISCRNLLIYLQPLAQRKVLSMLHFSLRTRGVLFLGPSETAGELGDEFDPIEKRWKLFQKRRDVRLPDTAKLALGPSVTMPYIARTPGSAQRVGPLQRAYEAVTNRFAPPSLLLNEQRELVHVFGDARKYLQVPDGQHSSEILKMVDGDLRLALSAAMHKTTKEGKAVVYSGVKAKSQDGELSVRLSVEPLTDSKLRSQFLLVIIEPQRDAAPPSADVATNFDRTDESVSRIVDLEQELKYTKEHLQTTVEELETSNEELQSTNEELVASNEELQSTNEELHSVNEELYTVNSEHQRVIEEMTEVSLDMENLLRSTEIGTVFVDENLAIRKFTPAIHDEISLLPQDVGRPISHISHNLELPNGTLADQVKTVLESNQPTETEVRTRDGKPLLMRGSVYRTEKDDVAGVVLSFVDITSIRTAEEKLESSEKRLRLALQAASMGTWTWNVDRDEVACDDAIYEMLGIAPEKFGHTFSAFSDLVHPDDREDVARKVENAIANDAEYDTVFRVIVDGEERMIAGRGRLIRTATSSVLSGINWDVTAQSKAERARATLAAIVESSQDAMLSGSMKTGQILNWNPGAERLFGYTKQEAVGMPIAKLYPEDRLAEKKTIFERLSRGEAIDKLRTVRLNKLGEAINVSMTISPIRNSDGQIQTASVVARDITEIIRSSDALQKSNERLEQINSELREFTFVASHDLREPLRTINSFCELLSETYKGQFDEQADRWIDFMVDATGRLQRMIDDLLAYSRLDSKAQPPTPTDCNATLESVLSELGTAIEEAEATVTHDELPTITVEPTQLHQLLQNLVGNAVKYRGERPPTVHVSAERIGNAWEFSVKDNGIGIKPNYQSKVFELFKRLNSREEYTGTGIGLAVCRKIVQRHGGKIWVESTLGEGSTFSFTLPVEVSIQE